jgi:hypothetical protein
MKTCQNVMILIKGKLWRYLLPWLCKTHE